MNRLRKRLIWLGALVGSVLLLTGGLWSFVLYTESGARVAVSRFLDWYNEQIPGTVTVQQVDGAIGEGLTLHNIEGRSANGRIVLRAGGLSFQLSPWPLLEKKVYLDGVGLSAVTLTSGGDDSDGALSDLIIPKKDSDDTDKDRLLPDLPVHLIATTVSLENIRFQKREGPKTLFSVNVDSVRGTMDWDSQLRVAVAEMSGDVAISDRHFDFSLDESQQIILRNDRLHTVVVAETKWGHARISLNSILEKSLQTTLSFRLNIDSLTKALGQHRLPGKRDGKLIGKGHVSFRMADNVTPVIDASFQSENSRIAGIGDVGLNIDAGLHGKDGKLDLRAEAGGLRMQGAYEGDVFGTGKGTLDLKGKISSQLLASFGVKGSAESVEGNVSCRIGPQTVCDSTVQSDRVVYEDIQAQKVVAEFKASIGGGAPNAAGTVEINSILVRNQSFERIGFAGSYDGAGATLRVDAAENSRQKAFVEVRLDFTDGITANVASLKSDLFGVQLESLNPFGVRFAQDQIKTLSPALLRLNDAVFSIKRLEKVAESLSGEASFEQLRLDKFSALAGEPLSGQVNGNIRVSGKMSNPSFFIDITASEPSLRSLSFGELRLTGEFQERQLAFEMSGKRDNKSVFAVDGHIPVSVNLNRRDVQYLNAKPARVSWRVHQFDEQLLRDWMDLPDGLTFGVNGSGKFFRVKSQMTLTGEISGNFSHPKTGPLEFQMLHSLQPDEQSIQLQITDRDGMPVSVDVEAELPMFGLLEKQFPRGPVMVEARIGDSQLEIDAQPIDDERVFVELKVGNFDLSRIARYADRISLNGDLAGNVKLVWNTKTMSLVPFTDSPWRMDLQLQHLNPSTFSRLGIDTGAMLFEAAFDGALRCDGKTISANGALDGWLGDGAFIRFPVHLNFDASPTAQSLDAEWLMPNGVPAQLEVSGSFDVLSFIDGRFAPHSWQASLLWGDASLTLLANINDLQNGVANFEMKGLSPTLLKPLVTDEDVTGTLSGNARIELADSVLSLDSDLQISNGALYGWKFEEISILGAFRDEQLNIRLNGRHQYGKDFYITAEVPIIFDPATGRVSWTPEKSHRLDWRIPPANLYPVRNLLGIADIFDISLGTEGVVSGGPSDFVAKTRILGTVRAPGISPVSVHGDLSAAPREQKVSVSILQDKKNSSTLSATLSGDIAKLIAGKALFEDVPITARLQTGTIDLHFLELFPIPVVSRLGGSVKADLRIEGTMGMPRLLGQLTLADGRFSVAGLANRIHGVNGDIRFYGQRLSVPKLQFKSARGAGRFWGKLRLEKGTLLGSGTLRMIGFPVAMAGLPRFIIDTESSMNFSLTQKLLDLSVDVHRATFTKPAESRNSAQFIPTNGNVTVRDSAEAEEQEKRAFDYNIRIQSQEPISVKGKDLSTNWNTMILANRTDGVATVGGNIDAVGGNFSLFQNSFDIQKGELTLAKTPGKGAFLQLESSSNISSYTVYLNVSGNLLRPKLRLSSSPVLTEEQILTLLVSGSTEEDAETSTGAVTNLLAVQYPGIHNLLYNKFGISKLRVETTDQGSTALKAGRRVTDRSTVYTVVNSNPAKNENELELQVEVDLSNKTSVGTAVGENSSSIGIYRRFIIPNKKRKILKLPFRRRKKK